MSLPVPPSISQGEIALDPVNGIVWYLNDAGTPVATTWSWLRKDMSVIETDDKVEITGDVDITGNLYVEGSTITVDAESVVIKDNFIVVNSSNGSATSSTAGIEVERGASTNVQIRWNESTDKWQFTNDGSTFYDISSIVANSVELGTHTTGDYVENLSAGSGISISGGTGESSNPTISNSGVLSVNGNTGAITGIVTTSDSGTVTSNMIANNTIVNADINTSAAISISKLASGTSGQVIIANSSGVPTFTTISGDIQIDNSGTATIQPNSVNLSTDTVGDYVKNLVAGTGITITNNSGESATPNISFSGSINDLSDVTITSAQNGQILEYDGTAWVNTVRPSSEPIGHENKDDSVISFNESSREFSISPASTSYTVWCTGKRYVKTSTETITIPDTSGLYYIYFNSSGSLAYKTTFFTWDQDTPTAYIYWNDVDNKAYFFADERHGVTLDWATHEYLHRTRGAAIANGFGANNYSLTGDGSLDSHAQIDIADGTFFDEDLQVDVTHSASPTANTWQQRLQSGAYIPVFYRSNGAWKKDTATQFPIKNGGTRAQYNLNTSGTWSATEIDNSKYGVMFIVATNNLNEPVLAIMGQAQYTDQGSAEASTWDELDLAGFPIVEFRPLYKIVFQTATAYSNTPKTKFVNLLDLRQMISIGSGAAAVAISDHGSMTGLQDDDHLQYLNTSRHDSHDHSSAMSTVALDDISDIQAATPTNDQVLTWDNSISKWIAKTFSATVTSLDSVGDVTAPTPSNGDFLKWNGTAWVNDSIDLGTDTAGNYMSNISAGTGIDVSHTQGEGSTATVSVSSIVVKTTDTGTVTADMLATGPAKAGFKYVINAVTSGGLTSNNYDLISSDLAKLVTIDNGSTDASVTIPLSFLSQGDRIDILNRGTGLLTIKIASGGTLYCTPQATANEAKLRSQWSSATIVKLDSSNTWLVIGDLQA